MNPGFEACPYCNKRKRKGSRPIFKQCKVSGNYYCRECNGKVMSRKQRPYYY